MLSVDENINLYGDITDLEGKKVVGLNANFNAPKNFNIGINIIDEKYVKENKEEVQKHVEQFLGNIKNKLKELGYVITI